MDLGFDGLIVESHCSPDDAWSDAKQLMEQINRDNPGTKDRIMHAVVNGRFEDWPEVHRN
jgi:3-deoxy-D-arabino-heptulosonate 7-phosphate (DAHP) synthase